MRKFLIIILLFVFFISFISARGCIINEDDLKIVVGVYDKIQDENKFVFEKSRFQPNDDKKIVQVDDVLIIESFNIKADSTCSNLIDEVKKNGISLAFIRPNETHLSESISITLDRVNFQEKNGFFEYSFNITNIDHLETKDGLDYFLEYLDLTGNSFGLNYVPLNKVGEWEIMAKDEDTLYRKNILNEGGYFRKINVLDRIDVAQLETLEQLKEDSNESATHAINVARWAIGVAIFIGFASIFFMWLFHKREEKREINREKEKQINLLKSLEIQLKHLSEGTMEWNLIGAKSLVEGGIYPAYQIWKIETFHYLINLSFPEKESEINKLKESLIKIDEKISIINNYLYGKGLDISKEAHRKAVTKLIDGTIEKVKKLKRFIEENFDIKSKK